MNKHVTNVIEKLQQKPLVSTIMMSCDA